MNTHHNRFQLRHIIAAACIILIGSLHCSTAAQSDESQTMPPAEPCPITADWLYNPVNQPVMVVVEPPMPPPSEDADQADLPVHLVLLTYEGEIIAPAQQVRPGRVDLAEAMPGIWELRETAYLQTLVDYRPVGAALVVQPMLSRLVPQTEQVPRPGSNATYTRIIGWRSSADPRNDGPNPRRITPEAYNSLL